MNPNERSLRRVVLADGIAGLGFGVLLVLAAGILAALFGMPQSFVLVIGLILLPYGLLLALVARRVPLSTSAVWAIIVVNFVWVLASIGLLVSGVFALTLLGNGFVVAQAVMVAGFGIIEYSGIRRLVGSHAMHTSVTP